MVRRGTNKFTNLPPTQNTYVLENATLFLAYCRTRNLGNCEKLRGSDQTVNQRTPPATKTPGKQSAGWAGDLGAGEAAWSPELWG